MHNDKDNFLVITLVKFLDFFLDLNHTQCYKVRYDLDRKMVKYKTSFEGLVDTYRTALFW